MTHARMHLPMLLKSYFFGLLLLTVSLPLRAETPVVETDQRLHADGKSWKFNKAVITDTTRPRVLLIGDSILGGYMNTVIDAMKGKAYVDAWMHPHAQSENLNKLLAAALKEHGPYDIVHFNMGLHGWQPGRIKEGTFKPLTLAFIEVIRTQLPKAKIIWASSTPVTVKGKPGEADPVINPIIIEHNRLAAEVMAEAHVPIDDLYALLAPKLELARGDQFHWKPEAYQMLAKSVTESLLQNLPATASK